MDSGQTAVYHRSPSTSGHYQVTGGCLLMRDEMGYIYLMKPVGHNVYKIGETIDIEKRMARMQKKKDYELECLYSIEVTRDIQWQVERKLHNLYSRYRLASEWFALPQDVVDNFIEIVQYAERSTL